MSQNIRILLDRAGDATPPAQYVVVNDEVSFLQHAYTDTEIVLRGEALCRWAEVFYSGRNVKSSSLQSPSGCLRSMCPGLTQEFAVQIVQATPQLWKDPSSAVGLEDILRGLYPDGPWAPGTNRLVHGASWLLWLSETNIPDYVVPLISLIAAQWEQASYGTERLVHSTSNSRQAKSRILEWFGVVQSDSFSNVPFPLPIPNVWIERLHERWAYEIIQSGMSLFEELATREAPRQVMECAAEETYKYLCSHKADLTQYAIERLGPFLSIEDTNHLRKLLPPDDPGELPANIDEVIVWFEKRYLPYRNWEVAFGDAQAHERVHYLARRFAEWYLEFYGASLSGGSGKSHLVMSKSAALLADQTGDVVLWVVLDGLSVKDAAELVRLVQVNCPRLSVRLSLTACSTLPTITSFAKPALLTGLPPALAVENGANGEVNTFAVLNEGKDPASHLKSAEKGNKVAWLLAEPDRTYHKPFEATTITAKVQGELRTIADQICRAVASTPDYLTLRVVITTDHGRLFSTEVRSHPVPKGMVAHGRAAWGKADVSFGSTGVLIDTGNRIAYLSKQRFNLQEDCAVALDADSFMQNDGKGGNDQFSHGGVYPEEVLVPWTELSRDAKLPKLRVLVSGKAKAGKVGRLRLSLDNASDREVLVNCLSLRIGADRTAKLNLSVNIEAKDHLDTELDLDNWPSKADAGLASGTVSFALADGQNYETPVQVEIDTEEMYSRDFSLEDL